MGVDYNLCGTCATASVPQDLCRVIAVDRSYRWENRTGFILATPSVLIDSGYVELRCFDGRLYCLMRAIGLAGTESI